MSEKRKSRLGPNLAALDKFAAGALTIPAPTEEPAPAAQPDQSTQPKDKKTPVPPKKVIQKPAPPTPKLKKEKAKGTALTKKSPPADIYPWDEPHVRADVKNQLLLRIPEPLHLKLGWLAKKSPSSFNSMTEIILAGTERLVEEELKKIIG